MRTFSVSFSPTFLFSQMSLLLDCLLPTHPSLLHPCRSQPAVLFSTAIYCPLASSLMRCSHCSCFESILLLGVLPMLDQARHSYWLTAFPLHLLANNWSRMHLSALLAAGMVIRIGVAATVARRGDWLMAPLQAVAAVASIPMLLAPNTAGAVYLGLIVSSSVFTPAGYRGLAFRRFGTEVSVYRRALRTMTCSEVFGYSLGSLVAGAIFDHGGWVACAVLQMAMAGGQASLLLLLPVFHEARPTCA